MKAAILVLSDKGSRGERQDTSGPALEVWLAEHGVKVMHTELIPDDEELIIVKLMGWSDSGALDLVVTCGGTGVSPRDVTPEATLKVVERVIPGFGEEMRRASLTKTPHAMVSRAIAGIRGATLIINLPGSPKGATENLAAIWPAVPHAIVKIKGDSADCVPPS
jgi:molybdenum cofactor synthesis domain-containing protein